MDLTSSSMIEIATAVRSKKVSAREVTTFFTERVARLDKRLNSFITVNERALEEADAVDALLAKGTDPGPLAGVPIGIKDMFCTRGLRTTAASKILENFVPPYDATAVARLRAAGIINLGKLNLDEFAMGSSNETSFFGAVRNPWDEDRVAGGSSGGSAAATAARLVAGSLGTDTGGSIRQPASFCGIVGVKPTYGRISRYGIVAYASSLDQAGPMTTSVADAALVLEIICGHDAKDATTSSRPVPTFSKNLNRTFKGKKIGVLKECMTDHLHKDVRASMETAIRLAREQGAEIVEVSVPLTQHAVAMYYLIASSEASSNLARYDGVKYGLRSSSGAARKDLEAMYEESRGMGFGTEVKRRIMLGTYCLSSGYYEAYYNKAGQVRRLLRDQYMEAFRNCDVIVSPVATHPAFKIGERIADPLTMYLNDIFTVSTNLAGLPGMSVPFGLSGDRLPIGLQITAKHFDEQTMLDVGGAFEDLAPTKGEQPRVV